jgi:hypothetical protein
MSSTKQLADLPVKPRAPYGYALVVNSPWRLLEGAHGSVSALLDTFDVIHEQRSMARGETRGRLSHDETDILRAAIVFTSSALDATMRRLLSEALPPLLAISDGGARKKYEEFLRSEVASQAKASSEIVEAILSRDPAANLITAYIAAKTASSFQGSGDIKRRVRDLLGVGARKLPDARIEALDPFFEARNAIAHDMDYENVREPSRTTRHNRSKRLTVDECGRVFELCAQVISATAHLLGGHRP